MMGEINELSQGDPAAQAAGHGQQRVGEIGPGPDQTEVPSGAGLSGPGSGDSASGAMSESERAQADRRRVGAMQDKTRDASSPPA